jgi:hypothetical protein
MYIGSRRSLKRFNRGKLFIRSAGHAHLAGEASASRLKGAKSPR